MDFTVSTIYSKHDTICSKLIPSNYPQEMSNSLIILIKNMDELWVMCRN